MESKKNFFIINVKPVSEDRDNYKYRNGSCRKEQVQPQFGKRHVQVYYHVNLMLLFLL